MADTNKQIQIEIDQYYKNLRMKNEILRQELIQKIYKKYPILSQTQDEIDRLYLKKMKNQVFKKAQDDNIDYKIRNLEQQKDELIEKYQIDKTLFKKIYKCKYCKDTGIVISPDGKTQKCICYINRYKKIAYGESEILELTKKCNFKNFNLEIFDDRDLEDQVTQRQFMKRMLKISDQFIKNIDNPQTKSLLFYGNTGQGKTYLSLCIAEQIIRQAKTVVYKSSIELFDRLASYNFSQDKNDSPDKMFYQLVYEADLLIIDDLGVELINSFTKTQLFNIINERVLKNKKTIISTNINITDIQEKYDERIFSRLVENYSVYKFIGSDRRIYRK